MKLKYVLCKIRYLCRYAWFQGEDMCEDMWKYVKKMSFKALWNHVEKLWKMYYELRTWQRIRDDMEKHDPTIRDRQFYKELDKLNKRLDDLEKK